MLASASYSILKNLVQFDTTSRNSNLELVEYIRSYLSEHGIASRLIPNSEGNKASLFATIGSSDRGGLGLSAHTDVVPVDGQDWSSSPFGLSERDNRLYGRGTCDMKGFIACVLAMVPEFVRMKLATPVHLLFSYDEEIGCTGVRPMIAELGQSIVKPEMIIVGEPTEMKVVEAHKGIYAFQTEITGKEVHSSVLNLGVNAVSIAARLIAELENIGTRLAAGNTDEAFMPAYSSIHVGKIAGGTALNIVPRFCKFVWEVRSLPGLDIAEVLTPLEIYENALIEKMRTVSARTGIKTLNTNRVPAFQTSKSPDGEALLSLALKCAEQNRLHVVSYGTEAGLFENGGCPAVICGPGSIEQAHQPDEYIEKEQMEKCIAFLKNIATTIG